MNEKYNSLNLKFKNLKTNNEKMEKILNIFKNKNEELTHNYNFLKSKSEKLEKNSNNLHNENLILKTDLQLFKENFKKIKNDNI